MPVKAVIQSDAIMIFDSVFLDACNCMSKTINRLEFVFLLQTPFKDRMYFKVKNGTDPVYFKQMAILF